MCCEGGKVHRAVGSFHYVGVWRLLGMDAFWRSVARATVVLDLPDPPTHQPYVLLDPPPPPSPPPTA